jgi:hypothetical protein
MTKQWLWLATPHGGGNLINPEYPRLTLEVAQVPSGRLTARWRDVATGITSEACVTPFAIPGVEQANDPDR